MPNDRILSELQLSPRLNLQFTCQTFQFVARAMRNAAKAVYCGAQRFIAEHNGRGLPSAVSHHDKSLAWISETLPSKTWLHYDGRRRRRGE